MSLYALRPLVILKRLKIKHRFFLFNKHTIKIINDMIFHIFQMAGHRLLQPRQVPSHQAVQYSLVLLQLSFTDAGNNQIVAVPEEQKIEEFL